MRLNRCSYFWRRRVGAVIFSIAAIPLSLAAAIPSTSASIRATHTVAASGMGRERLSLDRGWLFHLGDVPPTETADHDASYDDAKAGNAWGAAGTDFDDSTWRHLDLPHDWVVEGPFDPAANMSQGYRPRGVAWYRRYLRVDASQRGRAIELQLDGMAPHATVWVNGTVVRRSWTGYNGSNIDLTPFLRYGDEPNTIAIRIDANAMEGWWYEGAGMVRHTWLETRNALHVVTDGVAAMPRPGKGTSWRIPVEVTLNNSGRQAAAARVEVTLYDPAGKAVASNSAQVRLGELATTTVQVPLGVTAPALWSLEKTNLYRLATRVIEDGKVIDETSLQTGFRRIRFDADHGFFLNGIHMKLQGVCVHLDHAGVGVAVPEAIWAFRLRRLKEMGVNAIRFSHNAPPAEVLDLIDRMGFVVMDENRNFNPSPDYVLQLEAMVKRDRHHPSVILWSVLNEEPLQTSEVGYEMARRLVAAVKALDTTRPVSAAMNGGYLADINAAQVLDVVGSNYHIKDYDAFHKAHPTIPFTSSEDTSGFMTRGEYRTVKDRNLIASYDDEAAPWGATQRGGWEAIAKREWMAGGFIWTGFDYRGEPTPNTWPSVVSVFGIMDLAGFAKTAYYIHQVQWIKDKPLIYIAPHWNWAGSEGKDIRVMVMANVERIALLLNGRPLGEQQVDPWRMNSYSVPYEAGKLEAIAYRGGKEVARTAVETTGKAVALELLPDRSRLAGDGRDAMPITVRALDAQGRAVPVADQRVTFTVTGGGHAIGHGNGDPNSHEDEKGPTRHLFNGLAQLIVQTGYASREAVTVVASAPGLAPARLIIPVDAVPAQPFVAETAAPPAALREWRVAPPAITAPDATLPVIDYGAGSWGWAGPPMRTKPDDARFHLYRTTFTPRQDMAGGNGSLHFGAIRGKATVWLDGALLGRKDAAAAAPLDLDLPAGPGPHELSVILDTAPGQAGGMDGAVVIQARAHAD